MAINPESRFTGKINAADANYPLGSARDITTPGDGTGTPWKESIINDIWGLLQKLLTLAGITASGLPDTILASDYMNALLKIFGVGQPCIATGTGDAIVLTSFNAAPEALANGQILLFKATATNTGATTINRDTTGVKTLTEPAGTALSANRLRAGYYYMAVYVLASDRYELINEFDSTAEHDIDGKHKTITGTSLSTTGDITTTTGNFNTSNGAGNFVNSVNEEVLQLQNTNSGLTATITTIGTYTSAAGTWNFLNMTSDVDGTPDLEFQFSGDGNGTCDGSWTGGGAERAEAEEWEDGNPDKEDRIGMTVVLVGDKVRPSTPADDPNDIYGVASATYDSIGNAAPLNWSGKYLKDEFGRRLTEDAEVVEWTIPHPDKKVKKPVTVSKYLDRIPEDVEIPKDAKRTIVKRPILNPAFDPNETYVPRLQRKEWDAIGLLGIVYIRDGQVVNPRWRKRSGNLWSIR